MMTSYGTKQTTEPYLTLNNVARNAVRVTSLRADLCTHSIPVHFKGMLELVYMHWGGGEAREDFSHGYSETYINVLKKIDFRSHLLFYC